MAHSVYSLKSLHTFGLPYCAQSLQNIVNTQQALSFSHLDNVEEYCLIGEGSNCVFLEDFEGQIVQIKIPGIAVEETEDSYRLEVGAGEKWHSLVQWCLRKGLYGFENLALIPGTVGAAPIQNIGAYGIELERFVWEVEYVCLESNEVKCLTRNECLFGYRDSIFKHELSSKVIITKVVFALPKQWQAITHYGELAGLKHPSAEDVYHKVVEIRQSKLPDPKLLGNAGSFFKNPIVTKSVLAKLKLHWPEIPNYEVSLDLVKVPAAWLIDILGFKGQSKGGIRCHPNQPLVLTNTGQGTGQELLYLAREIKQSVWQKFGIALENEVQLIAKQGRIHL